MKRSLRDRMMKRRVEMVGEGVEKISKIRGVQLLAVTFIVNKGRGVAVGPGALAGEGGELEVAKDAVKKLTVRCKLLNAFMIYDGQVHMINGKTPSVKGRENDTAFIMEAVRKWLLARDRKWLMGRDLQD